MKRFVVVISIISVLLVGCGVGKDASSQATDQAASIVEETVVENDAKVEPGTEEDIIETVADAEEATDLQEDTEEDKEELMPATLLYQGHASVRIVTAEGKVIYIDPFMGEGYDFPADLILMTHGHYDHTGADLITSRNDDCQVIKWANALQGGIHQTFDLGYVKVEAVEAGYNKNHNASECVGYILTFSDGVSVYFSGDTSTTPTMADLSSKELDYAFICCDGVYNMDVNEASECAKLIGAKHTIPYHMIPAQKSGFDRSVAESFDVPGRIILEPGEELTLE